MILNNDKAKTYKIGGVMQGFSGPLRTFILIFVNDDGHELWPGEQTNWMASNYPVYVLLKQGTDVCKIPVKIKGNTHQILCSCP